MQRESWQSKFGFIFAAVGSAVGLANIWKFPYIVGKNGGAAFILMYLLCLALIGFPVLIAEILIGRKTQKNPHCALKELGKALPWKLSGSFIVITGLLISSFYSVVAGWIFGYLVEAAQGNLSQLTSPQEAAVLFSTLSSNTLWKLGFHALFMGSCVAILYGGVRKGIERAASWMMPLLLFVLLSLVIKGITLPNAEKGIAFLLHPDWKSLTPTAILVALGHAFFTLSLGQGTMITYGSYLPKGTNIPASCFPIALADTVISLMASIAVFTCVFSVGLEPNAGPGLIFHTLPYVFSQLPGSFFFACGFFLLVTLAALTSEISAMEPCIAFLSDRFSWSRRRSVLCVGAFAFLLGLPSAFSVYFLESLDFIATSVLVPFGGFMAIVLMGWKVGMPETLKELKNGAESLFEKRPWLEVYFVVGMKYTAPFFIILVFFHALGLI